MRKVPGIITRLLGKRSPAPQGDNIARPAHRDNGRSAGFNPLISKEISEALRQLFSVTSAPARGQAQVQRVRIGSRMPAPSPVGAPVQVSAPPSRPANAAPSLPPSPLRVDAVTDFKVSKIIAFPGCEAFATPHTPPPQQQTTLLPRRRPAPGFLPFVTRAGTSWDFMSAEERSAYIFSQWNTGKCIRVPR